MFEINARYQVHWQRATCRTPPPESKLKLVDETLHLNGHEVSTFVGLLINNSVQEITITKLPIANEPSEVAVS